MIRFSIPLFVLLYGFFASVQHAIAQIAVETMILEFDSDSRPVRNFIVRNAAETAMLVKTESFLVTRGGFPDEKLEPTEDFLVSPREFSIAANGERTVRLLLRKPEVEEQTAYRVNFVPQAREEAKGSAKNRKSGRAMNLTVMTGMGILVFVNPSEKRPVLESERQEEGDILELRNAGNVNFYLDDLSVCTEKSEESCGPLQPRATRMYPHNTLRLSGVKGKYVRFLKRVGDDAAEEIFIE